ncbi:MAG: DNA mismatch repair endonuclease MutL [Candidatus Bruticola sp.]
MDDKQPRVRLLEKSVYERIAAGEVVDRPVSVIKELVENALDASSSRINVSIRGGGREFMQVVDDGCGMSPEDARLSVQRFATSKLKDWEDLDNLYTLGFRGEALPSIAAVSRLEIRTCQSGDLEGTLLTMEGASDPKISVCAAVPGTRITVRDLFFNTPARLKFLRSASAESSQITDLLGRLSAAWPEVAFSLTSNGKEVFSFSSDMSSDKRLAKLWKLDKKDFIPVFANGEGISLDGFVAKPETARSNRTCQLFVMNGRIIRSQNLSQALAEGFGPLIEKGKFPVGMMRLSVDPAFVDVNVHPAKLEVRFADPRPVFSLIYRAVSQALETYKADSVLPKHFDFLNRQIKAQNGPIISEFSSPSVKAGEEDNVSVVSKQTVSCNVPLESASKVDPPRAGGAPSNTTFSTGLMNRTVGKRLADMRLSSAESGAALELYAPYKTTEIKNDIVVGENTSSELVESSPGAEADSLSAAQIDSNCDESSNQNMQAEFWQGAKSVGHFKVLGQVYKTFIVGVYEDKLWLVDQHTAQERINYESFAHMRVLSERSQGLLIPEVVEFTPDISQFLQDSLDNFREYGYEVENFGHNSFALRGVPASLPARQAAATFSELVEELAHEFVSVRGGTAELMREKIRAMASCKAAVKAGDVLSLEAMEGLVNNMLKVEHSLYCPHGRPTRIILEEKVLERLFHRI